MAFLDRIKRDERCLCLVTVVTSHFVMYKRCNISENIDIIIIIDQVKSNTALLLTSSHLVILLKYLPLHLCH